MNYPNSQQPLTPIYQQREFWWVIIFSLLIIGSGIGLRAPWPADEPRFVLVAQQMWESGDWWFPQRGQQLYSDKPPLYFWLLAGFYSIVRNWNWAFLLPSLTASLITITCVFDLARRLWNTKAAVWSALSVVCTFQFMYQAKRAQIDPLLIGFTTFSLYAILRHTLLGPHWRWYFIGCIAAGLGVISKGVGFLPLLVFIPYSLMRLTQWNGLSIPTPKGPARWVMGIGMFLLPILLWLIPMVTMALFDGDARHQAYLQDILFRQTGTRYVNAWHHHKPAWYFIQVIILYWLPFSIVLPFLIQPFKKAFQEKDARIILPLAWFILVIVFFSISPGKRDMYILPALPGLALAAAPFLADIGEKKSFKISLLILCSVLGIVLMTAGGMAYWGNPSFKLKLETQRGLVNQAHLFWLSLFILGGIISAAAIWARSKRAVPLTLITMFSIWFMYGVVIAPQLDGQNSAKNLMQNARNKAGDTAIIGLVDWSEQHLLQAVGKTTEFGFKNPASKQWQLAFDWLNTNPQQHIIFAPKDSLPDCVSTTNAIALGTANRTEWWLISQKNIALPCNFDALDNNPLDIRNIDNN